jgi:hypothetical protein
MKFAWVWVDLERNEKLKISGMKFRLGKKIKEKFSSSQIELAILRNG